MVVEAPTCTALLEFISLIGIFLVMSRTQILVSCVALLLCVSLVRGDKAWWCDDGVNESKLSNSLQNFYLNTVPLSWHYTHNWGSEECPCEWFGVDCTGKNGTVSLYVPIPLHGWNSPSSRSPQALREQWH